MMIYKKREKKGVVYPYYTSIRDKTDTFVATFVCILYVEVCCSASCMDVQLLVTSHAEINITHQQFINHEIM